jgi:uncharacterized protein
MVVIQPTPFCNIDCDYCYLRQRRDRGLMRTDTVEAIAERIIEVLDPSIETLVVWHGGEPTTVPLDWFRSAYTTLRQHKRGTPLAFALQTNGIAIDDDWARFIAETETRAGLSIDGPEDLHNRHRKTRTGRPTWYLAMRALDTLRRNGVEPGIITVLTADSLRRADDMLAFFVEHSLHNLSFSVEEREGANATSSLEFEGVEHTVEEFLLRFMEAVTKNNLPIHVREAERILALLAAGGSAVGANEQTEALAVITVDWTGGVYTYSPEFTEHAIGEWGYLRLGSVHQNTLAEISNGEALGRLTREVSTGLAECASACSFWEICGGGSPVNRLAEHGSLAVAETQFCRLTVQATARALQRLLRSTDEFGPPHDREVGKARIPRRALS